MYQIQLLRKFWAMHIVVQEERAKYFTSAVEKGANMVIRQDPELKDNREEINKSLVSYQEYAFGKFVVRIVRNITDRKPLFGGRR